MIFYLFNPIKPESLFNVQIYQLIYKIYSISRPFRYFLINFDFFILHLLVNRFSIAGSVRFLKI